jgi:hypothetical protein
LSENPSPLRIPRILWAAFAQSFLIFIGVVFFTLQGQEPNPDAIMQLGLPLGVIALLTTASMPFLRTRMMGVQTLPMLAEDLPSPWHQGLEEGAADKALAAALPRYQTGLMVGMAMCEATVLFGFSLAFVGKMPVVILPFAALGLAGLLWQFPTEKSFHILARALADKGSSSEG